MASLDYEEMLLLDGEIYDPIEIAVFSYKIIIAGEYEDGSQESPNGS